MPNSLFQCTTILPRALESKAINQGKDNDYYYITKKQFVFGAFPNRESSKATNRRADVKYPVRMFSPSSTHFLVTGGGLVRDVGLAELPVWKLIMNELILERPVCLTRATNHQTTFQDQDCFLVHSYLNGYDHVGLFCNSKVEMSRVYMQVMTMSARSLPPLASLICWKYEQMSRDGLDVTTRFLVQALQYEEFR
jgi:hypothetical protein